MEPLTVRAGTFEWGSRTYVMGILNITPDSFSGDGLLAGPGSVVDRAVAQARRMVSDGAEVLDIGGESTRPGHVVVDVEEQIARVAPVVAAVRSALPDVPISVDTTKAGVAAVALDAGADIVNDVWGVDGEAPMLELAAGRRTPVVLMHNRAEPVYRDLIAEVLDDLRRAIDRAIRAGIGEASIIVDPGFGFGKTAAHNLLVLRELDRLRELGRPILVGTSRKSTLGKVLDLPADERLEATLATTALAIAAGADIIRVHDVRENVRAARMTDAIVRGVHRNLEAPLSEPATGRTPGDGGTGP